MQEGQQSNSAEIPLSAFRKNNSQSRIHDIAPDGQLDISLSSYKVLSKNAKYTMYSFSTSAGKKMALKVPSSSSVKYAKNLDIEFEVTQNVSHHAFRSSITKTTYGDKQALLLEWADGYPIDDKQNVGIFDNLETFYSVAREILSALQEMHTCRYMHMDLTCNHIIFDPESCSVKIIDCASSAHFSWKSISGDDELLTKDLHYVSPELLMIRLNKEIDFRCDFYSVGVVFYKMLSGRFPFESNDRQELVLMHISQTPQPLCEIDPSIPIPLSNLVMKLLEKNADDRYHSTKGIIFDLDLMSSEYSADETLSSIVLGQRDVSEDFFISKKIYGRAAELSILSSVFDAFNSTSLEIIFVAGRSGTGKSSIISEMYKYVLRKHGILGYGKYDYSRYSPYSAIIQAINSLCDTILLKDPATISNCRFHIKNAVREGLGILIDVIPNLYSIIGEQSDIARSNDMSEKNKFLFFFVKLIKVFCSFDFPVVLVLEDLQLLDSQSLQLLVAIVSDRKVKNLLIVGSYRKDEVDDENPIAFFLKVLQERNLHVTNIELNDLDPESTNDLISDTLCVSPFETYAVTAMVYQKTKGNPFFVNCILRYYFENEMIFYSKDESTWKWDKSIFSGEDVNETSFDLLRTKISSMDDDTQQTLKIASCLGSPFSLSNLMLVKNCKTGIENALSQGLITQYKGSKNLYQFSHDQVQQAVCSLIPRNSDVFLFIGVTLWKYLPIKEHEISIFTVVEVLSRAIDGVYDQEVRGEMAGLFYQAGQETKRLLDYEKTVKYLNIGIQLLGPDCWKDNYNLSIMIYLLAANAVTLCHQVESRQGIKKLYRINELTDIICHNSKDHVHIGTAILFRLKCMAESHMYSECLNVALEYLDSIGVTIDLNQSAEKTASEIQETAKLFSEIREEDISSMKINNDVNILSALKILVFLSSPLTNQDPKTKPIINTRILQLTHIHGLSVQSAGGFLNLGLLLASNGDKLGLTFGKVAIALGKNIPTDFQGMIPGIYNFFYGSILPWFESIHNSLEPLVEAYVMGRESGNIPATRVSYIFYFMLAFVAGKSIEKLLKDVEDLNDITSKLPPVVAAVHQVLMNLHFDDNTALSGDQFNFEAFDDFGVFMEKPYIYLLVTINAYVLGKLSLALKYIEACAEHCSSSDKTIFYPIQNFYAGLSSIAIAKRTRQDSVVQVVREIAIKLKDISNYSPKNFLNKVHLLEAEIAAVTGDTKQAEVNYELSISLSQEHMLKNEEAIACERAGIFFLDINEPDSGLKYLSKALKCYNEWGAKAKVKQLISQYPSLVAESNKSMSNLVGAIKEFHIVKSSHDSISSSSHLSTRSSLKSNGNKSGGDKKRVRFSTLS